MQGIAYGARSAEPGGFEGGLPMLDVEVGERRVLVVCEEPYASMIAEAITEAEVWADLPMVTFEEYQVAGEGR